MLLYNKTTFKISQLITRSYSTSFSIAVGMLDKNTREAIYSIYGFVRIADEIVDTFHDFDKNHLLEKFEKDYIDAINQGISSNPVLNSFQITVKKYKISHAHIQAFINSMKCDIVKKDYKNKTEMDDYIYGSADVVGLMCLKVFCNGDDLLYRELEAPAMKLGSAFQKVNFIRDLKNDIENLDRKYFHEIDKSTFNNNIKINVIKEIDSDFTKAYEGIRKLPKKSKLAVLIAFYYYKSLLNKIKNTQSHKIIETRIRISNVKKMLLLLKALLVYKFNLI